MSRQRYSLQRSQSWDDKRVKQLEDSLANKQAFLDMARKASAEFSG